MSGLITRLCRFRFRASFALLLMALFMIAGFQTSSVEGAQATQPERPHRSVPKIDTSVPPGFATPGDLVARQAARAHRERFWHARAAVKTGITVDFDGKRILDGTMTYDIHRDRARIDLASGETLIFDGQRAWVSPASSQIPQARYHLNTWPYFLAAPFKLSDPNAERAAYFERVLNGRMCETFTLTPKSSQGEASSDWYLVYVDKEHHALSAMAYFVAYGRTREEVNKDPQILIYEDIETFDRVPLATTWRIYNWTLTGGLDGDPVGTVKLTNLQFIDELDESIFTKPADAREAAPLPTASASASSTSEE